MPAIPGGHRSEDHPSAGFSPVTPGWHRAVILSSEWTAIKPPKQGHYFKFEFEITEGEFKGRKFWMNLILDHPNEETVKIARGQLTMLQNACRVKGELKNTEQLHGQEAWYLLKIEESQGYAPQNRVMDAKPNDARPAETATASSKPAWKEDTPPDNIPF